MLAFLKIHAARSRTAAEFRMTKLNPVRSSWKAPCPTPAVTQFSRIIDSSHRDYIGAMRKTLILTGDAFYQEEKRIIHTNFRSMGEKVPKNFHEMNNDRHAERRKRKLEVSKRFLLFAEDSYFLRKILTFCGRFLCRHEKQIDYFRRLDTIE